MDAGRTFRINTPQVVHQTIDGEVVIINLTHGFYYSLRDCGAAVWGAIAAGGGIDAIVDHVTTQYAAERREVADAVLGLLTELEREELIVADGTMNASGGAASARDDLQAAEDRRVFVAPVLEKYADMQELLLLDPIHEVDETGWPSKPGERDRDD